MKKIKIARREFTIRPGMTQTEVEAALQRCVVRQPAQIDFCETCDRYIALDHSCPDMEAQ